MTLVSFSLVFKKEKCLTIRIGFFNLDASTFHKSLGKLQLGKDLSVFTERTEDSSASQYFQFYGYLSQQQNMMQDYIRTSTYQRAILSNLDDFRVRNSLASKYVNKTLTKILFLG